MEQIRISAKVLGQVAMPEFCPQCFWIKLHSKRLPWQIFPGIFSSIDAYTKKAMHHIIYGPAELYPYWLIDLGEIKNCGKIPHWSKFHVDIPEYGVTLSGAMDDIYEMADGSFIIPDYKTAKYTATQDKLLPMYRVQLNAYATISEKGGFFKPISKLVLVYFEPYTDNAIGMTHKSGFKMDFIGKAAPVERNESELMTCLQKTRYIYDNPIPKGRKGCKDCEALCQIINLMEKEAIS